MFLVDYNTFEGDSGGAVVAEINGKSRIVGLVHGQHLLNERFESAYRQGLIRKRLGFAIVVSSPLILETINLVK